MVNPVVYDPRYGQFGELDARCDNYLGRGQFARINPGTGGKPKTMLAGKVLPAVKLCQARWCKWGAQHCGRDWLGTGFTKSLRAWSQSHNDLNASSSSENMPVQSPTAFAEVCLWS